MNRESSIKKWDESSQRFFLQQQSLMHRLINMKFVFHFLYVLCFFIVTRNGVIKEEIFENFFPYLLALSSVFSWFFRWIFISFSIFLCVQWSQLRRSCAVYAVKMKTHGNEKLEWKNLPLDTEKIFGPRELLMLKGFEWKIWKMNKTQNISLNVQGLSSFLCERRKIFRGKRRRV